MRRLVFLGLLGLCLLLALSAITAFTPLRAAVRNIIRPEPAARITPLALLAPLATMTPRATSQPSPASTRMPTTAVLQPTRMLPTDAPSITPVPTPVIVNGRSYSAYIPAASKPGQQYQYSCEFDAAWVILQSYGFNVTVDELIALMPLDDRIEPYIEERAGEFIIHGGDISQAFSGDYRSNFLARSTGNAIRTVFEQYGLRSVAVSDRAGIEQALRAGALVWMKTTVDFKPWRPATWRMPDGRTHQTVLGNDHAVVVIGFNEQSVVIRDVLGPTSSNTQRPYEYEVDWPTFLLVWEAQSFDGLAVYATSDE